MNNLADNFYGNPDMVAYTQSAFICKYLIDKFLILFNESLSIGIIVIYLFNPYFIIILNKYIQKNIKIEPGLWCFINH